MNSPQNRRSTTPVPPLAPHRPTILRWMKGQKRKLEAHPGSTEDFAAERVHLFKYLIREFHTRDEPREVHTWDIYWDLVTALYPE